MLWAHVLSVLPKASLAPRGELSPGLRSANYRLNQRRVHERRAGESLYRQKCGRSVAMPGLRWRYRVYARWRGVEPLPGCRAPPCTPASLQSTQLPFCPCRRPAFVNDSFRELFAGGVPAATPLVAKGDGLPADETGGEGGGG